MGFVEFRIDGVKLLRRWSAVLGIVFTLALAGIPGTQVGTVTLGVLTVVAFIFFTLTIRSGKKILKHLEKHPEDARYYDDNPLG